MDTNTNPFDALKGILRHVQNPQLLDDHPWTQSLIVQDAMSDASALVQTSPGQQLLATIAGLFRQLQPANPFRAVCYIQYAGHAEINCREAAGSP